MTIYLGADHGGYHLKERAKDWLKEWGYETKDLGAVSLDPSDDYPVFAFAVAREVAANPQSKGLLFCRSGGGMVIAANRLKGVRAVDCYDEKSAKHSRTDNDANVMSVPADWLSEDQAKTIIKTWLDTPFSKEDRHARRIEMIDSLV